MTAPTLTREERARAMRAAGASWQQIADAFGVSKTTARRLVDPEFAERMRRQSREAKRRRTGTCRVCGGPTSYNGHGRGISDVCLYCNPAVSAEQRRKWSRVRLVAALWDAELVLGRQPGAADFNPPVSRAMNDEARARLSERMIAAGRWPWVTVFFDRFGSFSAAVEAAGMTPMRPYATSEGMRRRRAS